METTREDFLTEDELREFESFRFPSPPPSRYPTPPESTYFTAPLQTSYDDSLSPFDLGLPQVLEVSTIHVEIPKPETNPITTEQEPIAQHKSLCVQCKGQRYGFSAYFHNSKIFLEPPHHLLHLIEQSYFLRDRLKSLLVTYAMRTLEESETQGIEIHIHAWQREVACFANHVLCSAVIFELQVRPLDEMKKWTAEMSKQLSDHVRGAKKLEMPKGRLQILLSEFRRAWELVWLGYLEDERNIAAQYPQDFCQSEENLDISQWVTD